MNYKTLFTTLSFVLIFFASSVRAQVETKWETELPGNILWQQVTTLGQLVVGTQGGLAGIDSETGKVEWLLPDLANMPQGEFFELPDSPFFKIQNARGVYLIDQFSGDIIFDSQRAGVASIKDYSTYCIVLELFWLPEMILVGSPSWPT